MRVTVCCVAFSACLLAACYSGPIGSHIDTNDPFERPSAGLHGFYFLPRTVLSISIADKAVAPGTLVGQIEKVTLTKKVEPDPEARLLYTLDPSAWADDVLQVTTSSEGLLAAVSSVNTDRTADVAVSAAQLVFTVATGGAGLPTEILAELSKQQAKEKPPFTGVFDPTNAEEVDRVKRALVDRNYCLLLGNEVNIVAAKEGGGRRRDACYAATWYEGPTLHQFAYAGRYPGIYYRRLKPLPLSVYKIDGEGMDLLWTGQVLVFMKDDLYNVTIDRAAFVRQETLITFTDGSLTSIKLDKPSQVLAAVGIPVKIARIAFAIPLAGLQQNTAVVKAQTDLLNQQTALIDAQMKLVEIQAKQAGQAVIAVPAE